MAIYNTPTRLFLFNSNPPVEGLIAAWNLSNVFDSVGGNTLTNNNLASFVAGKIGSAVSLNGTTQYLSIVDNANISFGAGKKLTILGWFKINALPISEAPIIAKWAAAGNREYIVRVLSTGELQFTVSSNGTLTTSVGTGAGKISGSVFYFFTAWYDGNNLNLELNADGNIFKTAYSGDIFNGTSELDLGRNQETATFFGGLIDAVRLYKHDNRVLVASERAALYNGGLGREYVVNNIISSDEVNRELDQLVELFSGVNTEITPKVISALQNALLTVNQLGESEIAQFYKNGSKVLEILNSGQIKSYLATGTAPIVMGAASTGLISNLNVDLLDGLESVAFLKTSSKLVYQDGVVFTGNLASGQSKEIRLSSNNVIGAVAKARVAASNDSNVGFSIGIYRAAPILFFTLPNNNTPNFFSISNTFATSNLISITASTVTGSTPPVDVSVSLISQEAYV